MSSANLLHAESSPYLLQHAHNPVHWMPWGEAAFAEARRRNVPVFLSIGYATCYWCHVMERESFDDAATAEVMNAHFVCIKVDREERPEVDDLAMAATLIMRGQGGWPLSVFLEPRHLRPFWCGTYFPREPRHGIPAFTQVLEGMHQAWATQESEVLKQAEALADAVREHLAGGAEPVPLSVAHVEQAVETLLRMFDRTHGGFGSAPKFPQACLLEFLQEARAVVDDATRTAIDHALTHTLTRMAVGGLHDHVGGGFHRYCVDGTWTVPHFEKMLYDNALLARVYARSAADAMSPERARGVDAPGASAASSPPSSPSPIAHCPLPIASSSQPTAYGPLPIASSTLRYVQREMTHPSGGFFTAQDAEVDGLEGKNYLWTPEEIRAVLSSEDAALAIRLYGLDKGPNFKDPHHPDEPASNVLRFADLPERLASPAELERLPEINAALLAARSRRPQPRTDDKILTAWNGLMLSACARVADLQPDNRWALDLADAAAAFLLDTLLAPQSTESSPPIAHAPHSPLPIASPLLHRSWRDGRLGPPAVLEDYAFLAEGLLALHRSHKSSSYLTSAIALVEQAQALLSDGAGGFFDTPEHRADLFLRPRSTHDGALPCGVSVMMHVLIDLHEITGETRWLDAARACLASLSAAIDANPVSAINATRGLLRLLKLGAVAAGTAQPAAAPRRDFTPVEIDASVERLTVGKARPAACRVRVRIAPGYHLVAADPGPSQDVPGAAALLPTRVHVVHGSGIEAYADYPAGTPWGPDDLLVYQGEVEFEIAVERTGEWLGTPVLALSFQACSETECLSPMTLELDVGIDRE